jgi:hypothetical protein
MTFLNGVMAGFEVSGGSCRLTYEIH